MPMLAEVIARWIVRAVPSGFILTGVLLEWDLFIRTVVWVLLADIVFRYSMIYEKTLWQVVRDKKTYAIDYLPGAALMLASAMLVYDQYPTWVWAIMTAQAASSVHVFYRILEVKKVLEST